MLNIQQTQGLGCGIYAVANLLSKEDFLSQMTKLETRDFKGQNFGDLSLMINGFWSDIYLSAMYDNHLSKAIPQKIWELLIDYIEKDDRVLPFLLRVKTKKHRNFHLVAGCLSKKGEISISDSLKEGIFCSDIKTIKKLNPSAIYLVYETSQHFPILFQQ